MEGKLPRYKISIDPKLAKEGEKLGISQIAYTSTPAILTKGIYFSTVDKKMRFADELKLRVAAPALIPDLPIYRYDDEMGEYEVVFTKEMIEQMYEDFMENKGAAAFNLDHTSVEAPSFILECWLTGDPSTDKSFTKYGITVPEGSLFIVSQFKDKEYFQKEIIEKDRVGYSIEGLLALALNEIKQKLNKTQKMEKVKFEKAILDDGTAIFIDKMEVGGAVYTIDDNGDKAPIFDGEHKLKDGSIVATVGGKITEIKPVNMEEVPAELADATAPDATTPEAVTTPEVPAAAPAIDEAAIMAILQPKLDEIYKVIADIKTLIEADAAEDAAEDMPEDASMYSKKRGSSVKSLASFFAAQK